MEDILVGEQVIMDTFSLNGYLIVILFDSGATHDFIIKACTQKCQLIIEHITTPYMIPTLGGILPPSNWSWPPLNLAGRLYKTKLIVLECQDIAVILRMGWMKGYKALLDIVARTMQLESLVHGIVVLQIPSPTVTASALHNITTPFLEDIHVVREFLEVFPDDLPGMPPD
jgi:hypothetical protein